MIRAIGARIVRTIIICNVAYDVVRKKLTQGDFLLDRLHSDILFKNRQSCGRRQAYFSRHSLCMGCSLFRH